MSNQKLLKLTISKVDAPVFDGNVRSVVVPGSEGEMTLLANHEALISALKKGGITIRKEDGSKETITIESGTLEIHDNHATILL